MSQYHRIENKYHRTIVCGDIHGCFDEFSDLLDMVGFNETDVLICVGDMVDRGPHSWRVAEFFRDTANAYCTLGNHERRIAGTIRGTSHPAWSQLQSLSLVDQSEWTAWADYFEELPAVIETPHAIVTHAQLDPGIPLEKQEPYFTCAVGGPSVVIDCDENGVPLWYHEMKLENPVCMGHIGYQRVELVPGKLFALDTGAVRGGSLSAVVLPEARIISVNATGNYYNEARQRWSRQKRLGNQRLEEWRIRNRIPAGDPRDWPLGTMVELRELAKPILNPTIANALNRLESAVVESGVTEKVKKAKDLLLKRFGPIPDPGRERGEYYKELRGSFSKRAHGPLAAKLLADRGDAIGTFAEVMKKVTLRQACATLEALIQAVEMAET